MIQCEEIYDGLLFYISVEMLYRLDSSQNKKETVDLSFLGSINTKLSCSTLLSINSVTFKESNSEFRKYSL